MFLYLRIPKTNWLFARMSYSHGKLLVWNASIWVQWPCNRILSGVTVLMSPRTLLGTFNSAPVLSSGVNVKTSDDTDSFDLFVEKSTKAIEGQEKKKKQKAWSPLRWFHVFFPVAWALHSKFVKLLQAKVHSFCFISNNL